jgi:hypothetical protein
MEQEKSFKSEFNPSLKVLERIEGLTDLAIQERRIEDFPSLHLTLTQIHQQIDPLIDGDFQKKIEEYLKSCQDVISSMGSVKNALYDPKIFKCFDDCYKELLRARHKHGLYMRAKDMDAGKL